MRDFHQIGRGVVLVGTRIRSLGRFVAKAMIVGLAFTLSLFGPVSIRVVEAQGVDSVSGRVTNSNGDPVAGLRVGIYALERPFVQTNANGNYTIANVPHADGPYEVQLLAPCKKDQSKRILVNGPEVVNFTIPAATDTGGRYRCSLSTFPYIDGTTVLPLTGDDQSTPVVLPFSFPFMGTSPGFGTVHVSTNGSLNFLAANSEFRNTPLPSSTAPNDAIYPFWDDLLVDANATVRTATGGVSPNRFFVIEWLNVTFNLPDTGRRLDFEAVLFESSGRIVLNYRDIATDTSFERERGLSATVGIENLEGTAALQRSFNQPFLDNGLAFEFAPASK
jgi:carboxypeptidase family protein